MVIFNSVVTVMAIVQDLDYIKITELNDVVDYKSKYWKFANRMKMINVVFMMVEVRLVMVCMIIAAQFKDLRISY